jgi:hypothetical protein
VTVYVDDMEAAFGRMKMCHMIADTTEELLAMADSIGVQRKWIQKTGRHDEHFDIALSKRAIAIEYGATEVSMKELGAMVRNRRLHGELGGRGVYQEHQRLVREAGIRNGFVQTDDACSWTSGNEPCPVCPRRITALHMCQLLQDELAQAKKEPPDG